MVMEMIFFLNNNNKIINDYIHILLVILHVIWLSGADFACEGRWAFDGESEKVTV